MRKDLNHRVDNHCRLVEAMTLLHSDNGYVPAKVYCKELKLSHSIVKMAEKLEAATHQECLLKLLQSKLEHRESQPRDRLLKNAGFYYCEDFQGFCFDEVKLLAGVSPQYLLDCELVSAKTNLVMYGNVGTGRCQKNLFMERF